MGYKKYLHADIGVDGLGIPNNLIIRSMFLRIVHAGEDDAVIPEATSGYHSRGTSQDISIS